MPSTGEKWLILEWDYSARRVNLQVIIKQIVISYLHHQVWPILLLQQSKSQASGKAFRIFYSQHHGEKREVVEERQDGFKTCMKCDNCTATLRSSTTKRRSAKFLC
jgi:hypothetical protein